MPETERSTVATSSRAAARKSGVYAFGEAVKGLSQLATVIILPNVLTKGTFAELSFLILVYTSAIAIGGFNLHQSIFYFFERLDRAGQKRFILQTGRILAIVGGVALLSLALMRWVGPMWGFEVEGRLWKVGVVVACELPTLQVANILLARDKAGAAAAINLVSGLALMAALVVPSVWGADIDLALTALMGYGLLRFLVFVLVVRGLYPEPAGPKDNKLFWEQIWYTLPLGFAMLTGMLNRSIDKYVVAALCTPEQFASYTIAANEIPLITVLPYSVGAVLMAAFVRGFLEKRKSDMLALWHSVVFNVSLAVLPLVALFIVMADDLIVALFSVRYVDAVLPFQIYTVILFHRVAEYGLVLRAAGDTRSLWIASGVLLAGNVVLSIPCVLLFGMSGAALATLLANIPAWIYVLHRIAAALEVTVLTVFPWRRYVSVMAVSLTAGGVGFAVSSLNPWGPGIGILLTTVSFVITYVGLIMLFRVADVRQWIDLVRKRPRSTDLTTTPEDAHESEESAGGE